MCNKIFCPSYNNILFVIYEHPEQQANDQVVFGKYSSRKFSIKKSNEQSHTKIILDLTYESNREYFKQDILQPYDELILELK